MCWFSLWFHVFYDFIHVEVISGTRVCTGTVKSLNLQCKISRPRKSWNQVSVQCCIIQSGFWFNFKFCRNKHHAMEFLLSGWDVLIKHQNAVSDNLCYPKNDVIGWQSYASCQLDVDQLSDRAISAAGPQVWNYVPTDLRQPYLSCSRFRQSLKIALFGKWHQSAVWILLFDCVLEILLLNY